ncbi:patatin-domain-containing protein [Schizophyllum commune H4-8]|uniref:Lysophospholipase NTE1 n=1 Tax=Schizophyllum commune (strain H4-8 / FGSC 9210) TaxID=578458 RepID=D8PMP5_SCHCM|nr:patatin-domain-containing protein [Schizophyllum commune H4-8]KAI5898746.1 patatin-domain-containing protein [Schizophyllum commune H4-8]
MSELSPDVSASATAAAADVSSHPLVSLISACFWVILWALSWVKSLIGIVTISVPRLVYQILSYSMTLTLNFWSFVLIFGTCAVALNYFIRFRYLNDYMQLKEPPLGKPDVKELHPDVNTADEPANFHNYLDDFLQAVRVFGFLEKPVFHELARHLQTRRLIAGDSISLDQDRSFYCVVDGTVQVFAKSDDEHTASGSGQWDDEDINGYHLMNEVTSGGTVSSLFTILSLFTEDVKISWQDADESPKRTHRSRKSTDERIRVNSDVSYFNLERPALVRTPLSNPGLRRRSSTSSSASTVQPEESPTTPEDLRRTASPPPLSERSYAPSTPVHHIQGPVQIHRGVVARATEDTTLAVIPAEAFRRLTKKFPKATGHIVQVILTRFARVTFNAAHKYLGLTSEVLRAEKSINDLACHPLPPSFYEGGGLQQLRHRFEVPPSGSDSDNDYFTHTGARTHSPNPMSTYSPNPMSAQESSTDSDDSHPAFIRTASSSTARPGSRSSTISSPNLTKTSGSRMNVQAGDLLSSTANTSRLLRPINRTAMTPRVPLRAVVEHQSPERALGEEFNLREEVMSCIAKSIGLLQPPISGNDSLEGSPKLNPFERSRSPMPSSFGSLSLLDLGDDASSTMTGGSASIQSGSGMSGLDNEVEILFFPAGATLTKAGDISTGLYYVIEGFLDILLPLEKEKQRASDRPGAKNPGKGPNKKPHDDSETHKFLFTVKPGGIAGYLASLSNTASYVDIVAKTDTYVGYLPAQALERLLEKRPIVLLTLAKRLISLLSPLVLQIDASLDWMQVNAGQIIWRPEDASDCFYIVINGRLRAITETEKGDVSIVGEYGQGDAVGELDVITSSPRQNTLHAIRDTELIRMPQTLFNALSMRDPRTTQQILRKIALRVRDEAEGGKTSQSRPPMEVKSSNANLKTICILPVSRAVPIDVFARKLQTALEGIGASTVYLNQASVANRLGRHVFTRMGKLKAAGWLADQEQRYRTVLYVADSPVNNSWTQTCIRQADCVMVVGMGDDASIGEYERLLLSTKTTAKKELVLLHPDRSVAPGSTREWLKNRPWIHQHIHVELPGLVIPITKSTAHLPKDPDPIIALKNFKDKVQSELKKYRGTVGDARPQRLPHVNDFSRLARRICGKSIGLVLGGGGARGVSHLGLIRALEEYGIPVDHVGGTSIGAFIGGLYAREGDSLSSAGRAKQFSGRMGNIWRMLSDVTYPIVAYTTGHEFNRAIYKSFYDLHIEDMWLPFFCNTTNITTSGMDIHETGYAWRFIRGSMTLVGLLPPLCDNGNMHVDGGYVDNLPVSTMFSMGSSAVFACDVGSIDDNSPRNFGDSVSGWWLFINRWNPFSDASRVPAITEIQSRLAYVSSVRTLEEAKVAPGCLYIAMPVQEYGTLQFSKFEELQKIGYEAGMKALAKWDEEGRLPSPFIDGKQQFSSSKKQGRAARRNSI